MKKILFSAAIAASMLTACNTVPQYTIKGTIQGVENGKALLVKFANGKMDTLAQGDLNQGKFTLQGSVEGITSAYILVEGQRMRLPVLLENEKYTATIDTKTPMETKVTGPVAQNLYNEYSAILNAARAEQSKLYKAYNEAAQAKDEAKLKEIEEQYNKVSEETEAKESEFIKANADTYVAAYVLSSKMGGMSYEELQEAYGMLGENAKQTEPAKMVEERIAKLAAVAVGKVAPDFTLNTPEGKPLSMHSIKGKVKVIDFWASWCGPCRGENPNVVAMYKQYHKKGLEILSVSLDNNKEAWLKAIKDDKLTWNHVSDLKGWDCEAAKLYAVNGIPHLVVLDANNVIVAKDLRGDALKAKVAELLK